MGSGRNCPRGPRRAAVAAIALLLGACATKPPVAFTVDVPPDVTDARGRFDEIFCTVLQEHGPTLPDYVPCPEALSHVDASPPRPGRPVDLGESKSRLVAALVPGIGYGCIAEWMNPGTIARDHLRRFGYDLRAIDVDALSGTSRNARMIRDSIMALADEPGPSRLVLIGYSKGAPDILDAVVTYPEIRPRIAAVVSVAGAIGGSRVADEVSESMADMARYFPGAKCDRGDDEAVASLRPSVRKAWLVEHPLPTDVRYYSVVTLPDESRVSRILEPTYWQLSRIDARNDGQLAYTDAIIPGSTLLGFVNADHWAVALPIARTHPWIGALLATHNGYPREALLEAILRFVEEDLGPPPRGP